MEKLVCDKCGAEYTEERSIKTARSFQELWESLCRTDGTEPRGIAPCPVIKCPGQLVLKEE